MARRLGSGLGALIPDSVEGPIELELDAIRPNPLQPRLSFSPAGLEELRQSIALHGVLQPLVVRRVDVGYELVAGERRWRAARLAGLRTIPVVVRTAVTDGEMLELALVENLQREDLDPIERAKGFDQLMARLGLTQEEVAERVGLKRSSVANHIRLLELPGSVQQAVSQGSLSMGHARALLSLKDSDKLLELADSVVTEDLSVRDIEQRVRNLSEGGAKGPSPREKEAGTRTVEPWVPECEKRLQSRLGTRVAIRNSEGYRGQIVLEYFGREDLDRILDLLSPSARL